ncbi:MAG: hypothetical protein GF308_14100 [Candidatus Heimdallarchaeota archaeon]|nr:hypothetical protein [Candidatus Heimdallarchaeota archaeon]
MTKKFVSVLIFWFLVFLPIMDTNAVVIGWAAFDLADDVMIVPTGMAPPYESGDFHDEIDIIKLELVGEKFVITFQDKPKNDYNYSYLLTVFWNNENQNFDHFTKAEFTYETNFVQAIHIPSQGGFIVDGQEEGVITISNNRLLIPIVNYSLIDEPFSPYISATVISSYNINSTHGFKDRLDENEVSRITSKGGQEYSILVIVGSLSIATIISLKNRTKKKV